MMLVCRQVLEGRQISGGGADEQREEELHRAQDYLDPQEQKAEATKGRLRTDILALKHVSTQ